MLVRNISKIRIILVTWYCKIWTILFVIYTYANISSKNCHTTIIATYCFMCWSNDWSWAIIFGNLCCTTIKSMTGCTYVCPTRLIPCTELSVLGVAIVATFLIVWYFLYFYIRTWKVTIPGKPFVIILGFHFACCSANNGKYKIFEFHFYFIFIFYEK